MPRTSTSASARPATRTATSIRLRFSRLARPSPPVRRLAHFTNTRGCSEATHGRRAGGSCAVAGSGCRECTGRGRTGRSGSRGSRADARHATAPEPAKAVAPVQARADAEGPLGSDNRGPPAASLCCRFGHAPPGRADPQRAHTRARLESGSSRFTTGSRSRGHGRSHPVGEYAGGAAPCHAGLGCAEGGPCACWAPAGVGRRGTSGSEGRRRRPARVRGGGRCSSRGPGAPAVVGADDPGTPHAGIRYASLLWLSAAVLSALGATLGIVVLRHRRAGLARRVIRRATPIISGDALLPDHTDLLRELDPAHRARVHDHRRGHRRPASPPARRRDLLPHGRGRACGQGRARRGGAGAGATRLHGSDRRRVAGSAPTGERDERLLHPNQR